MSYTTIKAVWPGEKSEPLRALRNSHGSAPVVWNEIAKRYLGLKDHEYSFHSEKLWPLYEQPMPAHHRAVLLMTYDYALVSKEHYAQAAADIRAFLVDFPPRPGYVNHWPEIAGIFDSDPDCPAIGFYMTSVSEDLFQGCWNDETEEYETPDWDQFWGVYETCVKYETSIPA